MATAPEQPLDPNTAEFKRAIEEFKELGHEYRYREQLMVQEFSLTMVAIAGLLNVLLRDHALAPWVSAVLTVFGAAVLILIAFHLRNINQDRWRISDRKAVIGRVLGFAQTNQNIGGGKRFKVPLNIVRLVGTIAVVWTVWTVVQLVVNAPILWLIVKESLSK